MATGGPRLRALLALLLLDAGRIVTGERLIDGLYGEQPGAVNALQSQVSRLRRGLGSDAPVEFHPAGYRLAVDPAEVDALVFERLAAEGRAAGSAEERAAVLGRALGLWRGPALADVRDAPFAATQVTRLEELRLDVTEERIEAELALGRHRELVPELQGLVAAHPVRERLRGQLMRALYGSGRQSEALAAFEAARSTLAEELGVDPSPELAAVHLAVLRGELSVSPVPAEPPPASRGAPSQLTSFVGRQEDLGALADLLTAARLVTLIGPGGAGKTRLAIEVTVRHPGEVAFVELGELAEGGDVAQAVLAALGLRDGLLSAQEQRSPGERLVGALSDRPMLIVLDNCEHLIEAAAALAHRLLSACPGLRVLATSREALGVTGETLFPVSPLALPEEGAPPLSAPAIRLFADRAAAVRPGFAVDGGNAGDVLRICRALDGLPLAIELAAARLRSLPVAEVAVRLDDAFGLLSRGSRTAQPRHRTLRALVEWSWELLDVAEQRLARRLSVFAGGATLESIEAVCGDADADPVEVVAGLVDKSLVDVVGDRYRMLRTIHAFCAERLAEAGETERLRQAHAEHFRALMSTAAPHLLRAEQLGWLARIDAEHDNLLAAVRWAVPADPELGLRLVADLITYWWLRGRRAEGVGPARALLAAVGTEPPAELAAEYVLCVLSAAHGGGVEPWPHVATAKRLMASRNLVEHRPQLIFFWATFAGPSDAAYRDAMDERIRTGADPWTDGLGHLGRGVLAQLLAGDVATGEREFELALVGFRSLGERWGLLTTLSEFAELVCWRGDGERFAALVAEALRLADELGAVEDRADLLCRRGEGTILLGDLDTARADYEEALDLARRTGALEVAGKARHGLAEVARLSGDVAGARRAYEQLLTEHRTGTGRLTEHRTGTGRLDEPADPVPVAGPDGASGRSFGADLGHVRVLIALGWIAVQEGAAVRAAALQREAVDRALGLHSRPLMALAVEGLAGVAGLTGDHERAAALLGAARTWRGTALTGDRDVARVSALARERLGDAAYEKAYGRGDRFDRDGLLAIITSDGPPRNSQADPG
ncbi:BTAD domain-containing putative transcriptional regulator [Nonomuraea sp. NEAU-A123]|uniref:BTAD domain-containing putative transcriptional regulator n=1 Tax=Nonomuraea sp. NEAU-A123 TaxID=2839649 RepID=UPI001BE4840A|nr:BTAD domain-containing putative transcriptional regulator [Nonomuraea sp. NEAU-A123]MBT2224761.1 winged helix-turn-helix domain-containing protein [Nonomuraea sp. NEAU-A123]